MNTKTNVKPASLRERVYRQGFKDRGICYECKIAPCEDGFTQCVACRVKMKQYQKQWRHEAKLKIFDAYGGRFCNCCGETEIMFLCLDHINNDGAEHRRKLEGSSRQASKLYRWIIKNNFPIGFQVLCQNCNFGKHLNGGICPHKSKQVLYAS